MQGIVVAHHGSRVLVVPQQRGEAAEREGEGEGEEAGGGRHGGGTGGGGGGGGNDDNAARCPADADALRVRLLHLDQRYSCAVTPALKQVGVVTGDRVTFAPVLGGENKKKSTMSMSQVECRHY